MKYYQLILIFFVLSSSCDYQIPQPDNLKPMYGEVYKKNLVVYNSKEYKKADEEFIRESIKQFGSIDSAVYVYTDHAWRYYYNNSLETSMKRFNQVWLLNPDYPDSYFGFASLLESNGNFDEAKRFYKIAIEKDSNNVRSEICYQRIAEAKEKLGDVKGTIQAFTNITLLNPENSFAYKKIGYFQMELGNGKEALNAYNRAIQLDPNDAMTYNNKGYFYHTQKNYQSAIDSYSKAIEINPNYIGAIVNRGITLMELNQFEKAKIDFEKCVKLDPTANELKFLLEQSKMKINN